MLEVFIDLESLEEGEVIRTDLCIVGAGAAGITIAREFIGADIQVCLLESGRLELSPETQALYQGEVIGLPYFAMDATRLRYFGGTTNHWSGWCVPINEISFKERPWVPYSGWPVSERDLDPYYERAREMVEIEPHADEREVWAALNIEAPSLDPAKVRHRFWQLSRPPTRFGQRYRDALEKAGNVKVVLGANATNIETNESGSLVRHIDIRSLDAKTARVRARQFVLACGGIENPRLLMVSNRFESAGIGNRNDLVGRFFMDHPSGRSGLIVTDDAYRLLHTYLRHQARNTHYVAGICLSDDAQRKEQVLNACVNIDFVTDEQGGTVAAKEIWSEFREGSIPDEFGVKVWRVVKDFDDLARNVYRRYVEGKATIPRFKFAFLNCETEQAPNPQSRITLSPERDMLGLNRVRLDWRLGELEKRTFEVISRIVGVEFARLGLGRIRIEDWVLNPGWAVAQIDGSHHHIGTTRMAETPGRGVVDKHCKVHEVSNLYIGGSSVFPTSGVSQPTLTIVALALRLSAHLMQQFERR